MITLERTREDLAENEEQCGMSICPFTRKSAFAILSDLRKARKEIADGKGVPADVAMSRLGERYGFV